MNFLAGHMQPTTITCQRENCEFFVFSELNPCTNKESDNFEKLSPVFFKEFSTSLSQSYTESSTYGRTSYKSTP